MERPGGENELRCCRNRREATMARARPNCRGRQEPDHAGPGGHEHHYCFFPHISAPAFQAHRRIALPGLGWANSSQLIVSGSDVCHLLAEPLTAGGYTSRALFSSNSLTNNAPRWQLCQPGSLKMTWSWRPMTTSEK